jgi:predicted phosphodiesterase
MIGKYSLSLGLCIFALQAAPEEKVIGGPYVVNVSQRTATVMWVVQTGEVTATSQPGKVEKTVPVLRAQETILNGLKPGATYQYQAFPGDAGKGSFKTPPAEGAPFEFVVYGDTRTRHDVHRTVIKGILQAANPDFIMHTGDLVENGSDASLWPIYFDAEGELLRKAAIFPALGNHERHAKSYFEFMDVKPYYSFNWGNAHFIVLDSDIGTVGEDKETYWKAQVKWLEEDLAASQKFDFRFVFAHHPPMTAVKRRQGNNEHMTALEPIFEKHKVAATFFGHDHNYQHYLNNGIHYFITGGGGAPLYDVDAPPAGITKKVESTENFVIVKINGKKMQVEAKKPTGETIDTAQIGQ